MNKSKRFTIKNGRECIIRSLAEDDVLQVVKCINSVAEEKDLIANEGIKDTDWFKKQIVEQVQSGNWIFMVAEVGTIIGHFNLQRGYLTKSKHIAYIAMLLLKGYRNLGIGTAMMKIAMENAREKGIEKLYLSVFSSNTSAINFYKKCGFETEGILKKQFIIDGRYLDEVYMAKWL